MGLQFSRRVRIIPEVRLNFSKSGVSTSIGGRGAWFTIGSHGTRVTAGLPGTGLYFTQAKSWNSPTRNHSARLNNSLALPIPMERVNPERAADALATLIRTGVSYETRRIVAYTLLSYFHNSEGQEEAKSALFIIFEKKYPNRDVNVAMTEFDSILQTTITPEIHAAAEAARRANRPPYVRIILALAIGLSLLATLNDHHADKQTVAAPPVSPSISLPATTVIANYCDAHPRAPSCGSSAIPSAVASLPPDIREPSSFQSGAPSQAVVTTPTTSPYWCASLSSMVFDTPKEASKARAACGLSPPRAIPFVARHREFRAQVPELAPQSHHGRN